MKNIFVLVALLFSMNASALDTVFGDVWLSGFTQDAWSYVGHRPGPENSMVCNMKNIETSFLTLRYGCDGAVYGDSSFSSCRSVRKLNNLAVMQIDSRTVRDKSDGLWVRVNGIYRNTNKYGKTIPYKDLSATGPVNGWVHAAYLCDFIH